MIFPGGRRLLKRLDETTNIRELKDLIEEEPILYNDDCIRCLLDCRYHSRPDRIKYAIVKRLLLTH